MKSIGIIGGGAAGLFAAITAGKILGNKATITIYERKDRIGKKILATGNGKCNITNNNCCQKNYYGKNTEFINYPLSALNPQKTIELFEDMGLICKEEYGGRVFPYSGQASAVLDILRNELERLNINIITDVEVKEIRFSKNKFIINAKTKDENKIYKNDKLIVATGGKSSPSLGSNGSGFDILRSVKHEIIEPIPALCQLKTENTITKALNGIKIEGIISAFEKDKKICESEGEILFTNYGLSGSAVFDLSKILYYSNNITAQIDMMKEFSFSQLNEMLNNRKKQFAHLSMEQFFIGLLNKKVGQVICKLSGIEKLSQKAENISKKQITELVKNIKSLEIKVIGHNGWENSQVTAGGVKTSQFDNKTMESKIMSGLYVAGEVLDIFGDCGGYNLQWAWSTGYLAGKSSALQLLGE